MKRLTTRGLRGAELLFSTADSIEPNQSKIVIQGVSWLDLSQGNQKSDDAQVKTADVRFCLFFEFRHQSVFTEFRRVAMVARLY